MRLLLPVYHHYCIEMMRMGMSGLALSAFIMQIDAMRGMVFTGQVEEETSKDSINYFPRLHRV